MISPHFLFHRYEKPIVALAGILHMKHSEVYKFEQE
jgi:hypothetical protein